MMMKRRWLIYSLIFTIGFLYYLYLQRAHPLIGEEFILFLQGERVLRGEVPYRDFFQFITPGSIYLSALLFKLFGIKLTVMKIFVALTGGIILTLTYSLSRKIINNSMLSLFPPFAVLFYSIPHVPLFYHHWLSEIFVLLTILSGLIYIERKSKNALFLAGMNAGLVFFFLQHKGILIFSALVLFLFLDSLFNKKSMKPLLLAITGFFIPLILLLIYLYLHNAAGKFLYNCFYWVITSYSPFNSLPEYLYFEKMTLTHYLQREGIISALLKTRHYLFVGYLPVFVLLYGIIELYKYFSRNILYILVSSFFLYFSALQRPDFINILYVSQPFFVLLGCYLQNFFDKKKKIITVSGYFILSLLILNTLYGCLISIRNASAYKYHLKTHRGIIYFRSMEEMKPYSEVFSILDGELRDRRVFVYNWSTFLYFLSGKENYTSYDSFLPGYNTPEQMDELIGEIKNGKIEYIIYDALDLWIQKNGEKSLYPMGSKKIQRDNELNVYIRSHYEIFRELEYYTIYKLKDLS